MAAPAVEILLKRAALGFGALAVLLAAPHAIAAQEADGKHLYRTRTCVACHGRDGVKAIQAYPQLAGLERLSL